VNLLVKSFFQTGVRAVTRMLLEKRSDEELGTQRVFASLHAVAAEA
jgi:hypothetical protein